MANDYVKGTHNYPPSFAECFALPLNHTHIKTSKPIKTKDDEEHEGGLTLAQRQAKPIPVSNGNLHPNIQCNNCDLWGQCSSHCPNKTKEDGKEELGLSQVQSHAPASEHHVNFNQASLLKRAKQVIPTDDELNDLILLNSVSAVHLFKN